MFFDELTSQTNSWDFSKLLYTLPTGSSKRRCLSTGELDRERNFFSPLIITGERSVLETTDKDMGGLWISEAKLQEVVKENNFGDLKSLKKAWYASGLIKRDNQRHYSTPHKLNGVSIKCVCFILQEEPKCISSSTQDRLQTIKAGSKVRELLEEEEE